MSSIIQEEEDRPSSKTESKKANLPLKSKFDIPFLGIVFTVYTIVISFHLLTNLKTQIVGYFHSNDLMGTFHLYWLWKKYMALNWNMSFHSGMSLAAVVEFLKNTFHFTIEAKIYHFLNFLIFRFLEIFWPFPAFYNISIVISYGLNGFAFSILGLYLFRNKWIAAATGMLMALSSPVFISYLYGMNEVCWIFPVPLYFLCLIKLFEEKERLWIFATGAAFFLSLATCFYWFFGILLGLYTIIILLYYVYKSIHKKELFRHFLWMPLILVLFSASIAPFVYPVISEKKDLYNKKVNPQQYNDFVFRGNSERDLSPALRTMSSRSASILHVVKPRGFHMNLAFIPLAVTVGFLLSIFFIKKIPGLWYIIAVVSYLFSLGPYLVKNAKVIEPLVKNPLYELMLSSFRPFTYFRWPFRFAIFTEMAMLIICGYAIVNLIKRFNLKHPLLKIIPSVILVSASLYQIYSHGMIPFPVSNSHIPEFYHTISSDKKEVNIIHLPFTSEKSLKLETGFPKLTHEWVSSDRLNFYKTIYKRNVPYKAEFLTSDPLAENFYSNSFIKQLANKSQGVYDFRLKVTAEDYDKLYQAGYRYIVVHDQFFRAEKLDHNRKELYQYVMKVCGKPISNGYDYENLCPASNERPRFNKRHEKYWATYLFKLPDKVTPEQLNDKKPEFMKGNEED